jgi:hypothetical protein
MKPVRPLDVPALLSDDSESIESLLRSDVISAKADVSRARNTQANGRSLNNSTALSENSTEDVENDESEQTKRPRKWLIF